MKIVYIAKEEMIERVKANPLAMEIINKMPFTVKW